MNKVILIGRLVRDAELRFVQGTGTAVANFTIAVDRKVPSKDGKKEADFIPIVVFGKMAETVANYTSKGKLISVAGRIQTRSYDGQDGRKVYVTEVVSDEIKFLEWSNSGQGQQSDYSGFVSPIDDSGDEVPF